jgi:hypothetical protein
MHTSSGKINVCNISALQLKQKGHFEELAIETPYKNPRAWEFSIDGPRIEGKIKRKTSNPSINQSSSLLKASEPKRKLTHKSSLQTIPLSSLQKVPFPSSLVCEKFQHFKSSINALLKSTKRYQKQTSQHLAYIVRKRKRLVSSFPVLRLIFAAWKLHTQRRKRRH